MPILPIADLSRFPLSNSTPPRPASRSPDLPASRSPPRGDASPDHAACCASFNPRPREGATLEHDPGGDHLIVSIHAPAKGRLRLGRLSPEPERVSIHAPAKGRRRHPGGTFGRVVTFQSTPPRRGDVPPPGSRGTLRSSFNPRPREGATWAYFTGSLTGFSFNPRPREGATPSPRATPAPRSGFQSTPPRRGDHMVRSGVPRWPSFNPRPREGATRAACRRH